MAAPISALKTFLKVIQDGRGLVPAMYSGWVAPLVGAHEASIVGADPARQVRLPGWVRDDLSYNIGQLAAGTTDRVRRGWLTSISCYYLRPLDPDASAVDYLAPPTRAALTYLDDSRRLDRPGGSPVVLPLDGWPDPHQTLRSALNRDAAFVWLKQHEPDRVQQFMELALRQAKREAGQKGDSRAAVGVDLVAAQLITGASAPVLDSGGRPFLRESDKTSRRRRAWPLVLMCLHAAALEACRSSGYSGRSVLAPARLLAPETPVPLTDLPEDVRPLAARPHLWGKHADSELLRRAITAAWSVVNEQAATGSLELIIRYAAHYDRLFPDCIDPQLQAQITVLSVAVRRRTADRAGLSIGLNPRWPTVPSRDGLLTRFNFSRERLLLASHYTPATDRTPALDSMAASLDRYGQLLSAEELRRMRKVLWHLAAGVHMRKVRELPTFQDRTPTPTEARDALRSARKVVNALVLSFAAAHLDGDHDTWVNAHRRRTEIRRELYKIGRVYDRQLLTDLQDLERTLEHLDRDPLASFHGAQPAMQVLYLLAEADQSLDTHATGQARMHLADAVPALMGGIPHLAIRAANIAARIGDETLTAQLLDKVPTDRPWPPHLQRILDQLRGP